MLKCESIPSSVGLNVADRFVRGIDGIVVTNHAGRQVDGAIASLDALEKTVDAVDHSIYVSLYSLHLIVSSFPSEDHPDAWI